MSPCTRQRCYSVFLAAVIAGAAALSAAADPLVGPSEGSPKNLYAYALHLQLQGNYRAAGEYFRNLLVDSGPPPDADRLRFGLAQCHAALGEHEKAVGVLLQLVSLNSTSPLADDALMQAARIRLHKLDRPKGAIELIKRLRSEFPRSSLLPAALVETARAMECMERLDEAVAVYDQVLAGARQPVGDRPQVAALLAAERKRFIVVNGDAERRPLRMYLKAERLARDPGSRNDALLELIRLAGLYPDSSVTGDAFGQKLRIHLVKGDDSAARQVFDRLLKLQPRALSAEPARSCAMAIAGWLLEDLDRQIASNAEVLPELAGYKGAQDTRPAGDAGPPRHRLGFGFSHGGGGSQRHLAFHILVERPANPDEATYANLNLRVEFSISSSSSIVERELRRAVKELTDVLGALDAAIVGPVSRSDVSVQRGTSNDMAASEAMPRLSWKRM